MKLFPTLIAFLLYSLSCVATEQTPDVFLTSGEEAELQTHWAYLSPLEHYFRTAKIDSPFKMISTGNYRGFVAYWKIVDGKLFLYQLMVRGDGLTTVTDENGNDFEIPDSFSLERYKLEEVFKDKVTDNGVSADWYSGSFIVQVGAHRKELEEYSYMIDYTEYQILRFHNGTLDQISSLTPEQYWEAIEEAHSREDSVSNLAELVRTHYKSQVTSE